MQRFCETSSAFELDNIKNQAILRDFLIFQNWQHQKRSNSARNPSKTESWVQSCRPGTNAFYVFPTPSTCLKYCACHEKLMPGHTKCCTCHAKSSLTSKCASRHKGVQFFDISTSKSDPDLVCFVHFDFGMCFAPERHALFRHLNFQKCSEHGVFLAFSLANVLRATTGFNFSSIIWLHGSAPAALASLLFNPPAPQIIRKTQCFATFLPFRALGSSFFWNFIFFDLLSSSLLFSSLTLPISAFHLSILSEVWLLDFLRQADVPLNCLKDYNSFFQNNRRRTTIQLSSCGNRLISDFREITRNVFR